MKNLYVAFCGFCLLTLLACEEENLVSASSDSVVLEAFLHEGRQGASVRLNSVISGEELVPLPIESAQGALLVDGETYPLMAATEAGFYQNENLVVQGNRFYSVELEVEGRLIRGETFVPEKTEVTISKETVYLEQITSGGGFPGGGLSSEQIEIRWENPEESYFYVVIDNLESDPEFVNQAFSPEDESPHHFASNPEVKDVEIIDSRRGMPQYGNYRVIVFRVNAEYAALFEDTGDSSQSLSEPPSNVENGLGVFAGVSSDTVYFEVLK